MTNYTVIFEYLESQKTGLGFDLLALISDLVGVLEENPFLFQVVKGQTRRAVIKRFKYNLFYKIKGQTVFVIAILHGNKSSSWWQKRK